MAVQLIGGGAASRNRRPPMSEINVTPFVDVMLVLLVIFMITAPLLTVGVPVDLPKTSAQTIEDSGEPLVVTVDKEGRIYLMEQEIADIDTLVPRLEAIADSRGPRENVRIYVRGDQSIAYGMVMAVMSRVSDGGFTKVALIVELPQSEAEREQNRRIIESQRATPPAQPTQPQQPAQ